MLAMEVKFGTTETCCACGKNDLMMFVANEPFYFCGEHASAISEGLVAIIEVTPMEEFTEATMHKLTFTHRFRFLSKEATLSIFPYTPMDAFGTPATIVVIDAPAMDTVNNAFH